MNISTDSNVGVRRNYLSTKVHVIIATFLLILLGRTYGGVINAKSTSRADVASAVASAKDGDTVVVPAGTAQWTNGVKISTAITLQGAGMGQTIILDDVIGSGIDAAVFAISAIPGKFVRLTGFEIKRGIKRTEVYYNGTVQVTGTGKSFRIDHCRWSGPCNRGIYVWNAACGVIDHCQFIMNGTQAATVFHDKWGGQSYGDGSFSEPVAWGTADAVYFEDNYYTNAWHNSVLDSYAGARWVFRFNTISNELLASHGTESTLRYRGTRSVEIYGNRIYDNTGWAEAINLRSGTGVIWSNTISGYNYMAVLQCYRLVDSFAPWGAANGLNAFDTNSPTLYGSGIHTGPANSVLLVVSNAGWTVNQWQGYSVINTNTGRFGLVQTNSSNTMVFAPGTGITTPMQFNPGHGFVIRKVIQALDQPGVGTCDLMVGETPAAKWLNQVAEPVYSWGNNFNRGVNNGTLSPSAYYGQIRFGVHYVNGSAKPGYTPLVYPHPLTTFTTGGDSDVNPPGNLRFKGQVR